MLTTMETKGFCLCFILFIQVNLITGQSLPQEEPLNILTCTLKTATLNCSNDDMIAFQSAHFYYHASCEMTCCPYSSAHDTLAANPQDITSIRRACSGQNSCSVDVDGIRQFASGGKSPTYAILYYHCIPKSRAASICSAKTLTSGGALLYLTNEDFPFVTTDHRSCSCSLEVYSCASGVDMYLVDADMYLDETNCQQGIDIFDGKNASLLDITCASYYTNEISKSPFTTTNYIRIDFTDNSDANQEGIFFIGFGASEPNVAFKLSCAAKPQTTCIDCGTPNSIPNGVITLDNGTTSSGSKATVSCSNGYETDNATLICLETGQWTNTTCSPKDCGELYTILNGTLTAAADGSTTFGAKANVTCEPGYQVTGYCDRSTEFQCGDGTCIDKTKRCDNVPECPEQLDELLCENVISCPEGQKLCDVTCVNEQETCEESQTNVAVTDAGTISCLVIGKWEKVKCSAKDCGTPTDIENGNITLTEDGQTTYLSTADVTCVTGYTPSVALIACQADGTWENGTCNIIDCGVPSILNGTVTLSNPGESTFGSTAEVECSAGFTSSVSSITCLVNGQWEDASCDINDCGSLDSIENGTLQLKTEGETSYGSTATVSCELGFTPSVTEITCTANGKWENATCTINDCRELDPIKNGSLQLTTEGKTTYGSTATVTCDTGFTPSSIQITCQANSEWENATCNMNDCGSLYSIDNGALQLKIEGESTYGSKATVSCETGFTASMAEITCTANSKWENATCTINDCLELNAISNGTLQLTTEGQTTYGSTATVSCDTGFTPSTIQITCQANSEWENATCSINDCNGLDSIDNGTLQLKTEGKTTYGSKATVSCETGFISSVPEITCTANGEWENATCVINDCLELDPIENGTLQLTTEGQTTYGSTASVSCDTGFTPSTIQITCQANSEWENASCNINDCGGLVSIDNGTLQLNAAGKTTYGSKATVSCETGFTASVTEITCTANGEWENATCIINDCQDLDSITNGTLQLTTEGETTYGSTATITCDTGFTSSHPLIVCQANSKWENASCLINDCDELNSIVNGTLQLKTEGKTTYGSTATVSCETGFTPSVTEITCTANGEWENATCTINDCLELDQIKNGTLQLTTQGKTTYGSTASVTCDTGFSPSHTQITCQANSEWENATCKIKDCGELYTLANGTLQLQTEGKTYGSKATVSCETGYTQSVTEITCTANGDWENATCTINDCQDLDSVKNGTLQLTTEGKTTYGSTATVTCDTGFSPSPIQITCQANSEWENATCSINDCGNLDSVDNGTLQLKTEGKTTYGSTATVSCESGFTSSVTEITCTSNGEWENATCTIMDCGDLDTIANGNLQLKTEGKTTYGSTATISCDTGFTASVLVITCKAKGVWENATCIINDCRELAQIKNGTLQLTTEGKTTYGSTATVTCDTGFTASQTEIICQANSEWENATCKINDCGVLDSIDNGTLQLKTEGKTTYGSAATVSCETGFTPSVTEIICSANGEWENATCIINDCGQLASITNGTLQLTTEDKTTYGSTATVTCETGFTPLPKQIICQASSEWENATCKINDCGGLYSFDNGTLQLNTDGKTTYGYTATVSCETGFTPSVKEITCTANGDWENATCIINDCGELALIKNGTLKLTTEGKTTYGSTATVYCETGFTPSRESISCQTNSQWENVSCSINDCGTPTTISNGTITLDNLTTYLSTATVSCGSGYHATREKIICQANEKWTTAFCVLTDCGEPSTIENGIITLKKEDNTAFVSKAVVECNTGFTPSPSDIILCMENGTWETAFCQINDCGGLDSIANGTLQLTTEGKTTYGSTATVSCETGFNPSVTEITCTANEEWENATCKISDCLEPEPIKNGTLQLTPDGKTTYGSTATVTCDTGFTPSSTEIICQADNEWENATCKINDCGGLDTIVSGTLQLKTVGKTTYGSTATVSCETGFTPSVEEIACTANGEWENATCTINDCRELAQIKNGTLQLTTEGKTTYGSTATVTCDTGFTPSPIQITCQANSEWENAICKINDCRELASIKNGTLQLTTEGKTTYGSTATVMCDTGYTPSPIQITCQANSEWENATCKINDCGKPDTIDNGTLQLKTEGKTTYGSTATVSCEKGFTSSVTEITCTENGEWEKATCKINDCGKLNTIDNGTLQLKTEGKTKFGSTATVSCEKGFTSSVTEITCTANGEWENATCTINDCRELAPIKNGTLQPTTEGRTTYGSTARVTCDTGFTASTTEIICQANSEWENAICKINDCGGLYSIANGKLQLKTEGKTTYGSSAAVLCETGFTPSVTEISCKANGEWGNATCMINDCGIPTTISSGTIKLVNLTTYLSIATVSCESGYHATRETIICQANGTWTAVFCVLTDCGKPDEIENGIITLKKEDNTAFVSKAVVECETGFTPSPSDIILCMENGTWETAFCQINECGALPTLDNGKITLPDNKPKYIGVTAIVSCNTGYKKSRSSIRCLLSGQWQNASCDILGGSEDKDIQLYREDKAIPYLDCGQPPIIEHGNVTVLKGSSTTYDSVAQVRCHKGYKPKERLVACTGTGIWEISSCVKIDQTVFIILVAVGGAVLLIAIVIFSILIMWDKTRKTSANLHLNRNSSPNLRPNTEDRNFNETHNGGSMRRMDSFPILEELFDYSDDPNFQLNRYNLPMEGHIMYPDQYAELDKKILSKHEPHAWHNEMSNSLGYFNHGYRL